MGALPCHGTLPGWLSVVDQWTGFDDATDTADGVHPIDSGNVKIANRWYPALTAALP
jgi:lysophospholipase L1-like esterase